MESKILKTKRKIRKYLDNVSWDVLEKMIKEGLPVKKVGGVFIAHEDNIDEWLKNYTVLPTAITGPLGYGSAAGKKYN